MFPVLLRVFLSAAVATKHRILGVGGVEVKAVAACYLLMGICCRCDELARGLR